MFFCAYFVSGNSQLGLTNDPLGMEYMEKFFKHYISMRMSIGCYEQKDGRSKLVALSVLSIIHQEDKDNIYFHNEGKVTKSWRNVDEAQTFFEFKINAFQLLNMDKLLTSWALAVHRDYRKFGIGTRLLIARQSFSLHHGIKGTQSVFTGVASQRCGERAGFTTVATITWKDFAEAGFDYPADETKCIKIAVKNMNFRTMYFKRIWDESCPRTWDSWDGANGVKWVIRDLRPADDEEAIKILVEHWCPDESMYKHKGLVNDPVTIEFTKCLWRECLGTRTSLGCYMEKDGCSKLVALNVCCVQCQGEDLYEHYKNSSWKEIESKAGENVKNALVLCEKKHDVFKYLGVDKALKAFGLVVHRDYRGLGLGLKLLAARKSLALHLGVKGTATVFTGRASQILAERAGFTTLSTVTWKELHEAGLDYPATEKLCLKFMVKKYT